MDVWVGIDVSMETLDFGWYTSTGKKHFKVANTPDGFREALSKTPLDAKFVMEATGTYYLNLAFHLDERGHFLSVVNPLCTKSHMRSDLRRAKSDKTDALALSRFGQEKNPHRWVAISPEILQMRQLQCVCDTLRETISAYGNKIHAMEQCVYSSSYAVGVLEELRSKLELELNDVMASLDELASKAMGRTIEILDSLPGIGRESAVSLAVLIGDFQRFSNCRKLVSFCGLSPTLSQSGTSVHSKGSISRMGGHRIRFMLYVCTWSTLRHNEQAKATWKRMKENGKPGKVIIMALVNKMIRQMYSMVIHDTMYNPNFLAQAA